MENPTRGHWVVAFLITAALLPVAVLLHEVGHLVGYVVFGFPSPVLHYASTGFEGEARFWAALRKGELDAAAAMVDVWAAGVSAALGLLISYVTIGFGVLSQRRFSSLLPVYLGVAAAARFPLILLLVLIGRAEHTDEAHVSQALGVPFAAMVVLALVALTVAIVGTHRALEPADRSRLVLSMAAGAVVGTAVWMTSIGPALLP